MQVGGLWTLKLLCTLDNFCFSNIFCHWGEQCGGYHGCERLLAVCSLFENEFDAPKPNNKVIMMVLRSVGQSCCP